MVREQEPAKVLSPSRPNITGQQDQGVIKPVSRESNPAPPTSGSRPPITARSGIILAQPEFGKPTALGSPRPPQSRPQPDGQRDVNRGIGNVGAPEKYSNLFIAAKPAQRRPEHHKPPPPVPNPLLEAHRQAHKGPNVLAQPKSTLLPSSVLPTNARLNAVPIRAPTDNDLMEIPRPVNFPSVPPGFSSHATTNPYYTNRNAVDLTIGAIGMATNENLYDDRFGASDPYTYISSAKANENIKELLEGAFEDEDEKPRTKRTN